MQTGHRDIIRVRLRFLDLIKSFFFEPPDAELMSRWRGTFHALSQTTGETRLDTAIHVLTDRLGTLHLQDLQHEYNHIFKNIEWFETTLLSDADPLGTEISGETKATLSDFFTEAGIETADTSAIALVDALMSLIKSEKAGNVTSHLQMRLVSDFLIPRFEQLQHRLRSAHDKDASFYQDCCTFSLAYLEVEQALFHPPSSAHGWS